MALPRQLRKALLAPYAAVFYPLLAIRRCGNALRPGRPWRTWITPQLLVGGFLTTGDVEKLVCVDVRAVVNVSHELRDPRDALAAAGIAYLRVPCWDTRAPSLDDAARGVELIAREVSTGGRVYVHCASGVGRSVTVALCYLATREGGSVEDAMAVMVRRRPWISMSTAQRAFVERYVAWERERGAT